SRAPVSTLCARRPGFEAKCGSACPDDNGQRSARPERTLISGGGTDFCTLCSLTTLIVLAKRRDQTVIFHPVEILIPETRTASGRRGMLRNRTSEATTTTKGINSRQKRLVQSSLALSAGDAHGLGSVFAASSAMACSGPQKLDRQSEAQ